MIKDVKTVSENDFLLQACGTMNDNEIGSIVIVKGISGQEKVPVGILTERDVLRHIALDPSKVRLKMRELMSRSLRTIQQKRR